MSELINRLFVEQYTPDIEDRLLRRCEGLAARYEDIGAMWRDPEVEYEVKRAYACLWPAVASIKESAT